MVHEEFADRYPVKVPSGDPRIKVHGVTGLQMKGVKVLFEDRSTTAHQGIPAKEAGAERFPNTMALMPQMGKPHAIRFRRVDP